MTARDDVLARVRLAASVGRAPSVVPRDYRRSEQEPWPRDRLVTTFVERLRDYRAVVTTTTADRVPAAVADVVRRHAARRLVAPAGFPTDLLPHDVAVIRDDPPLTTVELDRAHAVVTMSAVAIAETGTVVLDAGEGMGRRVVTLVPDLHVVLVRDDQIVRGVPEAVARLQPTRLLTWISGPSATSDIELDRVEGVHGPRRLEVVLVVGDAP